MPKPAFFPLSALVAMGLTLAGCGSNEDDFDVSQQYGPDPVLPSPSS
jgi:hypothetical protein